MYYPSQAEKDDCRLYADNVQRVMSRSGVNIPFTHTHTHTHTRTHAHTLTLTHTHTHRHTHTLTHTHRRIQLPIGNQAVDDMMLMRHAKSAGLPFSTGMVVYFTANQKTGLKLKEMKRYLTRFASIDQDKDGYITINDLSSFLKVPEDSCLQATFDNCKKVILFRLTSLPLGSL